MCFPSTDLHGNTSVLFLHQNLSHGQPQLALQPAVWHVPSAVVKCQGKGCAWYPEGRGEAAFPKHVALCASAASKSFPQGSYRKASVGHFSFSGRHWDVKSSSLQRRINWTASPGAHSQWWPLHTQQNWLNVHLLPWSFSKASRSITLISDTLFYWRFLAEINVSMATVQKSKDSLKSNLNGSYLAIWQSFFRWYFSLGTSSYGRNIGYALWVGEMFCQIKCLSTTRKQVKCRLLGCDTSPLTLETLL